MSDKLHWGEGEYELSTEIVDDRSKISANTMAYTKTTNKNINAERSNRV